MEKVPGLGAAPLPGTQNQAFLERAGIMPREKPVASRRVKEFADKRQSAYRTNMGRKNQ